MQRAAQREEMVKKEEVKPDGNFTSPGSVTRKCVVIMEGDPHPGAIKGRMSFQSFNPSIDKLNEEASKPHQPDMSQQKLNEEASKPPQPDISRQKLNEEASKPRQPAVPATSSGTESGRASFRENESSEDEEDCKIIEKPKFKANRDHKRKQSRAVSESQYPNKSTKNGQGDEQASSSKRKGGFKKPKGGNLDWNLLRRSKS